MPQVAKLFRALSDLNRLRIVNILSYRDLCVCDLQSILDLSQPFISRHLAYLRQAGMVQDRREGTRVCYSLVLSGQMGKALHNLIHVVAQDSPKLQSDLRVLFEQASRDQLKTGIQPAGPEQLISRAA